METTRLLNQMSPYHISGVKKKKTLKRPMTQNLKVLPLVAKLVKPNLKISSIPV